MKPLFATGAILAATCGWLTVLFAARPFEHANAALDRAFGALPPWTQVGNLYRDARVQDVSRGDHPLESFQILRQTWAEHPAATRIVLMGNSQTQAVSLAPGEPPPSVPEKTYTDLMADRYREAGSRALFYRLAAGALSYQEMLWYSMFLAGRREIRPDVLLVQLNYQNFANEGIRAGMLQMLGDAAFRRDVEALARAGRPESDAFAEALRQFTATPDAPARRPDRGEVIETAFRAKLDRVPGFGERDRLKESFVLMLLRCRSYILHLEPGSRRSLGGPRVAASRAALEDLLDVCRRAGMRAVLFQAPTNPTVPLYKTDDDDRSYHTFVASVAARYGAPVLDFEHAVPAGMWGQELNGPDPLHLGRRGHLLFASLMLDALSDSAAYSAMQFNSYSYLVLLIPAVGLFWALPAALRCWYVLALSLAYYATWNPAMLAVPLLLAAVVYFAAQAMVRRPDSARRSFWGALAFIAALFLFFRYHRWLPGTAALGTPPGLSFYSFAAIAYLIDTRQGRIKVNPFSKVYTFLTFWPTVISGPILRFRELGPQLAFTRGFDLAMLTGGLDRLILGLVQKNLVANTLRGWVDEGFLPNAVRHNTTLDNWALAVAFGLEIYFDFAAYSNMAIGAARLIGVTLPENFRFPYHAASPPDFWARWHMSLSRWIRDYLFFPVNARFRGAPLPLYCSLLGIMALVGLWHGAGWGFVLWGILHGAYLVLYRIQESLPNRRLPPWTWRLLTLVAVTAAWVPFRAETAGDAARMLASMFAHPRLGLSYGINFYLVTLMVAALCAAEPYLAAAWTRAESWLAERSGGLIASTYLLRPLVYACGLLFFLVFDDRSTQFIYFQF